MSRFGYFVKINRSKTSRYKNYGSKAKLSQGFFLKVTKDYV